MLYFQHFFTVGWSSGKLPAYLNSPKGHNRLLFISSKIIAKMKTMGDILMVFDCIKFALIFRKVI